MRLDDFVLHPPTGVLLPPDAGAPAGYLDGAERQLLEVLAAADDTSVSSDELRSHHRDWATTYHLTPYRSTLFDCLGFAADDTSVLELGAGCGAVTRWLGEHFAEVHAVEGSADRAQVARTRCKDLDNVRVYSANYSQLAEQDRFDVATLIGVLEYGHLYHPETSDPHAAALANLRVVRRALRADGVLVLAIENKLGLKYLSGAREDHSARPFDSIEGYPDTSSAVTFSAREIDGMLAQAGFAQAEWYVPFPDYKLARTVVNVQRARDEHRVDNWLEGPAPDRGFARRASMTFNETLAQREIVRAGLLRDLANSFLVLAYAGDPAQTRDRLGIDADWTVRHYSLDRRADCRKRVTLGDAGEPVRHEPAFAAAAEDDEWRRLGTFSHRFRREPFQPGELLSRSVLATIARHGIDAAFADHVRGLGRWLVREHGTGGVDETGAALLSGDALDALWWNVVVDAESGRWVEIDREWRFDGVLPVDYVLWRALVHLRGRFGAYLPSPWREQDLGAFATAALELACGPRAPERIADFATLEQAFARAAAGGAEQPAEAVERLRALADARPTVAVLADADEIARDPALLLAFASEFDARDAVTLLLRARRLSDDLTGRLQDAIRALPVAEGDLPDLLLGATPADAEDVAIEAGAVAILGARRDADDASGLPRCGAGDLGQLRSLVAQRWDAASLAGARTTV